MVATGNTAIAALKMMKEWGIPMNKVSFLGIIASQSALDSITKVFPDVEVSSSVWLVLAQYKSTPSHGPVSSI